MILPLPTWPVSWSTNSPSGLIEGETYLPVPDGLSYSTDPADNTEAYWTAFNASNYTSLLEFAKETQVLQTMATFGTATAECGFSLTNGTARDLPAEVEWNQLTSSHEGPCEVWCDNTLVFEDWNCAVDYTSDPAKLPYDVSKCEGASMLTSIWLALHALPWQVYTNCAPLTGDLSNSVDSSTVGDDSTTTSATTTASASTAAEASFTDDYATSEDASASTATTASAATTSAINSIAASAASDATASSTSSTTTSLSEASTSSSATSATTSDKCSLTINSRNLLEDGNKLFVPGVILAASVLAVTIEAHSYMCDPMPTWSVGYPTTNYAGLIDGQDYLPVPKGMSYGGTPEGNTEAYWTAFNESKYTSLKDLADKTMVLQSLNPFGKATAKCGFSEADGTARDLPAKVQWVDFGLSHQGPCEVWCDDKLAFMDTNCALHYPEKPASLPYDISVCKGAKMIQSYWIALHGLPWQLYLNCVPLTGKVNGTANAVEQSSTTGDDSDPEQTTTTAPSTPTTDAPTVDTETASASSDSSTPTADAPETTTDSSEASTPEVTPATPTVTTASPTATEPTSQTNEGTGGAKCSRRRK
ncbi:Hypothetical protein PHPALM_9867 [Phytophthora palmivora]|uniref:Uncharacterized protein n=1 Tax=Phytophthora palmivora TaxID=4796 RepID=A0A2P4Y684_9STRA|nr:Hypothetical protein PHPALM_9867 [Phytophthora palmivora]